MSSTKEIQSQLAESPINVKADPDGQVWIHFTGDRGRRAMLNLNAVVLDMNPSGMTRNIALEAIQAILKEKS